MSMTLLHGAVIKNCIDIARMLVSHGAKVNAQDNDGLAPLHHAVIHAALHAARQHNFELMIEFLLDHDANTRLLTKESYSPMALAISGNRGSIIRLLYVRGAAQNLQDDPNIMNVAVVRGSKDLVQHLIHLKADVNASSTTKSLGWQGIKPLHTLAIGRAKDETRVLEVGQCLIENGAIVDAEDPMHRTPLCCAAEMDNKEMALLLLRHGAQLHMVHGKFRPKILEWQNSSPSSLEVY